MSAIDYPYGQLDYWEAYGPHTWTDETDPEPTNPQAAFGELENSIYDALCQRHPKGRGSRELEYCILKYTTDGSLRETMDGHIEDVEWIFFCEWDCDIEDWFESYA